MNNCQSCQKRKKTFFLCVFEIPAQLRVFGDNYKRVMFVCYGCKEYIVKMLGGIDGRDK